MQTQWLKLLKALQTRRLKLLATLQTLLKKQLQTLKKLLKKQLNNFSLIDFSILRGAVPIGAALSFYTI
jgi:hypothetical protein